MAFTEQELNVLRTLKDKGYSKEDALKTLNEAKSRMNTSGTASRAPVAERKTQGMSIPDQIKTLRDQGYSEQAINERIAATVGGVNTGPAPEPQNRTDMKRGEYAADYFNEALKYSRDMAGAGFSDIATGITGKPTYDPKTGEQNQPEPGVVGRTGQVLTGVGETIAGGVSGAFSPFAAVLGLGGPEIEGGVQKLVESGALTPEKGSLVEKGVNWYKNLPEDQKTQAQALFELATVGFGSKAKEPAETALKKTLTKVDDVIEGGAKRLDDIKVVRETKAIDKSRQAISNEIDGFIGRKRSLTNRANELKKQGTDVNKILKDPEIFSALDVADKRLVVDDAMEVIQKKVDRILDAKSELLPFVDQHVKPLSKEEFLQKALKNMDELTEADSKALIKRIKSQVDPLPDELSSSYLDEFRRRVRNSSRDAKGASKSASEYVALEKAARESVFEMLDNAPISANGDFAKLSQYVKNLLDTKNFLDVNARNLLVKSGKMTELISRVTGAITGSQFGIFGSLAGSEIGGAINNILANSRLDRTVKRNLLIKLIGEGDDAIKMADDLLKRADQYVAPQLPPPSATAPRTQFGSGQTINLPKESQSAIDLREINRIKR